MAGKGKVASTGWSIYARLHDALNNVTLGLKHTIEACNLIDARQKQGDRINYSNGKPRESAVSIDFAEPPPKYDHIEHEIKTAIQCMRDDWIPITWENLRLASNALNEVPPTLEGDLNEAAGDRWIIHTRRSLNDLETSPSPYRGFLSPPPKEAGFPRDVSEAMYVCKHGPARDAWRRHLAHLEERLAQLKACRPAQSASEVAAEATGEPAKVGGVGYDEMAVAVLAKNPDWTPEQVIEAIGCHVKTLYKPNMTAYKTLRDGMKTGREKYQRETRLDRRRRPSNIDRYEADE